MAKTQWEMRVALLNALEDMWCQFAYECYRADEPRTRENMIGRTDGGLSALENAFDVLREEGRIEESGLTKHEAASIGSPEELYPCKDCGKPRTKAEGGTTFTVCDECCDKHHEK